MHEDAESLEQCLQSEAKSDEVGNPFQYCAPRVGQECAQEWPDNPQENARYNQDQQEETQDEIPALRLLSRGQPLAEAVDKTV